MFVDIFQRVAFLIAVSLLGWYVGKKFKISSKDISTLLIYIFSPIVSFVLILDSPANVGYVGYSVLFYVVSCIAAVLALWVGQRIWKDNRANLFAAAGGQGNVGYFVLPLAIGLLHGKEGGAAAIGIIVFCKVASTIYEFTMAFYLTARSLYSVRKSLIMVAKMPTLHATILALIVKYFGFHLPEFLSSGLNGFTGGYSILGMMVIGLSLARYDKLIPDWKFTAYSIIWKQGLYTLVIISLFTYFFNLNYAEKIVLVMLASNPLAGNIAAVAAALDVHPEKAAFAIMVSTILALVTVPLTLAFVF